MPAIREAHNAYLFFININASVKKLNIFKIKENANRVFDNM